MTVAGNSSIIATDQSLIWSIAGAIAYGGTGGYGVSVGVNLLGTTNNPNATTAYITGSTFTLGTGTLTVSASDANPTLDPRIIAVDGSIGVGSGDDAIGGAGNVAVNEINQINEAYVTNSTINQTTGKTANVNVNTTDQSWIISLSGAVGAGSTLAVGLAVGYNDIHGLTYAYLDKTAVTVSGTVQVTVNNQSVIGGGVLGVGKSGGDDGIGGAGSASINQIVNNVEAFIQDGSNVNAGGAVTVQTTDQAFLVNAVGGVGLGKEGGAGFAVSYNLVTDKVEAFVDSSTVISNNSTINILSASNPILVALAVGYGSGGDSVGGAGSITVNSIANDIDAHASGVNSNSLLQSGGNITVNASDASTMVVVAGAGASSGDSAAFGASFAYNYMGGSFNPANPDVISFDSPDYTNGPSGSSATATPTVSDPDTNKNSITAYIDKTAVTAGGNLTVSAGFATPATATSDSQLSTSTATFNPSTGVSVTNNSITFGTSPGYSAGQPIVYNSGDDSIGGLVSGRQYTVIKLDNNTIKLAPVLDSGTDTSATFAASSTTVSTSANTISFPAADGFTNDQPLIYTNGGGSSIGGLVNGQTYYAIVIDNQTIELASTLNNAQNGIPVDFTSTGSGAAQSLTVDNSITLNAASAKGNAQELTKGTNTPISFSAGTAVNADSSITLPSSGLQTGDVVTYTNGSIGGLTDGTTYYAIPNSDGTVSLATTEGNATASTPTPISLTSAGAGTSQSFIAQSASLGEFSVNIPAPFTSGTQIISAAIAGSGGDSGAFGGAVGLNFIRNTVDAHISNTPSGKSGCEAVGSISVLTDNTSSIYMLTGGIAGSDSLAVGASIGVGDIANTLDAHIDGATVTSGGALAVSSTGGSTIFNAVIGGAGGDGVSIGGSIAVNLIANTTEAQITGGSSVISTGSVGIHALDQSVIATFSGGFAGGDEGAAGIAFAFNQIGDTVTSLINGSTVESTGGNVAMTADFAKPGILPADLDAQVQALAVSGAVSDDATAAISFALNYIRNDVEAKIENVASAETVSAQGTLSLEASDTSQINSAAGSVSISGSGGFGASVAYNYLGGSPTDPTNKGENVVWAAIENSAGSITAGTITLTSTYNGVINNATVAGTGGDDFAVGGAVSLNRIQNDVEAHVLNSTDVEATSSFNASATDTSTINSIAGQVTGSGGISVGAAVAYNEINNTLLAYAKGSTVDSSGGSITFNANSNSTIRTVSAGISIGATAGIAGSEATNIVTNDIEAYVSGATVTAHNNLIITASSTNTVEGLGGTISAGENAGIGGSAVATKIAKMWSRRTLPRIPRWPRWVSGPRPR